MITVGHCQTAGPSPKNTAPIYVYIVVGRLAGHPKKYFKREGGVLEADAVAKAINH